MIHSHCHHRVVFTHPEIRKIAYPHIGVINRLGFDLTHAWLLRVFHGGMRDLNISSIILFAFGFAIRWGIDDSNAQVRKRKPGIAGTGRLGFPVTP